jgi:hypothetical protein
MPTAEMACIKKYGIILLKEIAVQFLLIDFFRLLVYHKVNSIDCRIKRERFAEI